MLTHILRRWQWRKLSAHVRQTGLADHVDGVVNWLNRSPLVYRALYNADLDEYIDHLVGITERAAPRWAVRKNLTLLYQDYQRAPDVKHRGRALVCLVAYAATFTQSLASDPTDVLLHYLRNFI